MKKMKYLLIAVLSLGFFSCNDKNGEKEYFDTSSFAGSWCSANESGEVTELILSVSHSIKGHNYQLAEDGSVRQEDFTGYWSYASKNSILITEIHLSSNVYSRKTSYKVVKIDDNTMQLRNQELGDLAVYYRIVGIRSLLETKSENIRELKSDIYASQYYSTNSNIVSVEEDGTVTAKSSGVAFVMAIDGKEAFYFKYNVEDQIAVFSKESLLFIEDVLEKYGDPEAEGRYNATESVVQYLNHDSENPGFYGVQYVYSDSSHKISRIQTIYSSEETYMNVWKKISNRYYHQEDMDGVFYSEIEEYWHNNYIINITGAIGGLYWITYQYLNFL